MAELQKTTIRTTESGTKPNDLAQQLSKPESQDYLNQLDQLTSNPDYSRGVPPDTRQTLKDAVDQAKQAYQAKVDQNQWLDVAQTLGRAVAQFGAAQAGMKSGHDMSGLNMGQPIDYNARSDRAFREYQSELGNAKDQEVLERQNFLDNAAQKKEQYGQRKDFLSEALRTAREHESDDEKFRRAAGLEKYRITREDQRADKADTRAAGRESDAQRKLELAELNKQEADAAKKLQARTAAANNTELLDDLNKKSADKLEAGYGRLLAEGGLNISDVKAEKPGLIYGTNPDPEASKAKLDAKVTEVRNLLDGIKERKRQLISGRDNGSQVSSPGGGSPTAPAPEVGGKIRVRLKETGQTGTLDPKDFDPAKYDKL